jgi:hypothetical protein
MTAAAIQTNVPAVKQAVLIVVAVIVVLAIYTVYANVLSDDLAVRSAAELAARAKAGCGEKCSLAKMEGSRGAFKETLEFTFRDAGLVTVTCRRPYIAFGAYTCVAAK